MEPATKDYNCVVCFRDIFYCSVGVCEHSVCFECSARMRVLLGQNECPICRQELDHVTFTKGKRSYKDVQDRLRMFIFVPRYKIYMEDKEIQKEFDSLLEARCLLCTNNEVFKDFPALRHHIQRIHDLFACDLCVDHIKLFPVERRFYTRSDLAYHKRKGDKDDTSHRGHPLCQFCDRRYFDEDDLFKHLRKDHYFCHFCDADGLNHFYNVYDDLRVHFRCQHFLCEEENCKEEKFTSVFRTEIDLKAHLASAHSRLLGKHGLKQARHLDVEFNLAPRSEDNNGKPRRNFRDRGERSSHREQTATRERDEAHSGDSSQNTGETSREVVQIPSNLARLNLESSMDFPTLDGKPGGDVQASRVPNVASPASSSGVVNLNANRGHSISQRVALSNGMNVASKPMVKKDKNAGHSSKPNWNAKVSGSSRMDDEFPALRISEKPTSLSSSYGNSSQAGSKSFITATKISAIPSTKASLPPDIKQRQAVPRSEDFPELGLGSGSGNSVSRGSAWSGSGVKMKQGRVEYQGKKVAPAPVLPGRSTQSKQESGSNGYLHNEEDFKFVPLSFSSDRNKSKNNNFGDYQRK